MANTNLARIEPQQPAWNEEDKTLIKQTVAKGATDAEFKLLLYTASKYDLDPLVKQIWCVKYGDKPAAIYTSRDGFLHLAHKSGQFDGMETVALRDGGKLLGARCTVFRKGYSRPFVVEVALSEYNTNQNQWSKMPETMIKKVAESQALRRAFDISGLYEPGEIAEEGEYVETTARPVEQPVQLKPGIAERIDAAHEIKHETGITTVTDTFGTWASITKDQMQSGLRALIGVGEVEAAANSMGLDKFGPVIKTNYPDAIAPEQKQAAILHYAYTWRETQKKIHEEAQAQAKINKVFPETVETTATEIPEEDQEF